MAWFNCTTQQNIPETAKDFEGFIFRHNTGFMATFDTLENVTKFIETI